MATLTEQALGDISGIPGGFDLDIGLGLNKVHTLDDPDWSIEETPDPVLWPQDIYDQQRFDTLHSPKFDYTKSLTGEAGIPGKDIPWGWGNDAALREKILTDKFLNIPGLPFSIRNVNDPQVMRDLDIDYDEYDAMIHLVGGSTPMFGSNLPGYHKSPMDIYEDERPNPNVWETLKDRMNTLVGTGYMGTGATVKEMLDDPRTIITHEQAQDLEAAGLPSVDITPGGGYSGLIRPAGAIGPALASTDMMPYISDVDAQRGGYRRWADLAKRFSPISTAEAKNTSIFRSPRVAVEPTPEEEIVISEALMDFREPRIPFSLPVMLRGPGPADPAPFILDDQPDPYTSITTLPIGEEGWNPTLLSDILGGTVTDQPRTNLDGTITYLTNTEAMASDVQRALDRAGRIGPTPPVTAPEAQLQALTELAQTDPTIAERYTTPGSQDLIDIATQVEGFSAIQEADQQRMERESRAAEASARQDRERQEKAAADARKAEESARRSQQEHEARANRIRKEASARDRQIQEDDRKAIARANADAERARNKEREEAAKRRQAVEAARLNKLAEAARKQQEAEQKRMDDLLAKQMEDMMRSMEEARRRRYTGGTGGALMWT